MCVCGWMWAAPYLAVSDVMERARAPSDATDERSNPRPEDDIVGMFGALD